MGIPHDKQRSWGRLLGTLWSAGLISLTLATGAFGAAPAQADDATASDAAPPPILQAVVVTAQRVAENMQTVPITVNAVTGRQAIQRGVTNLQTLNMTIPDLVTEGNSTSFTYIRGVGSTNATVNNEGAVSYYVDGVYMPSTYGKFGSYNEFDLDQISVLAGPQGTLFGRNTTGGVIQVTTRPPSHTPSGDWSVTYGNYNTMGTEGYVTGGVTDDLAASLAVNWNDQNGNWGTDLCPNVVANKCTPPYGVGRNSDHGARTTWLWTPSSSTKITFEGDYDQFNEVSAMTMVNPSVDPYDADLPNGFPVPVTTNPGPYNTYGLPYDESARQYGGAVHVIQVFSDGLQLVSISSYRNVDGFETHSNNRTADNNLYIISELSHAYYKSQELQLIDQNPGRVTWLLGAYYFGDQVGYLPRDQIGSLAHGFVSIYDTQYIDSYSPYAMETTKLGDHTSLQLSARYTAEEISSAGQYQNSAGQVSTSTGSTVGAVPYRGRLGYHPWTYRAALDHNFSDNSMGYVSFTHGFKSGGFNISEPGLASFKPEKINSYELGSKNEFLNNRIRLNVSAFMYLYRDIQVTIVPGLSSQLFTNAGSAKGSGVDTNLDFAATRRLDLFAAAAYLHAYYTDYPDAEAYNQFGVPKIYANAAGFSLPYAPRYTGNVGFTYRMPTEIGAISFAPTLSYMSRAWFQVNPNFQYKAQTLLSAQLEWHSPTVKGFAVRLWGDNLLNDFNYYGGLVESSGGWYAPESQPPRTFGVTLLMHF